MHVHLKIQPNICAIPTLIAAKPDQSGAHALTIQYTHHYIYVYVFWCMLFFHVPGDKWQTAWLCSCCNFRGAKKKKFNQNIYLVL